MIYVIRHCARWIIEIVSVHTKGTFFKVLSNQNEDTNVRNQSLQNKTAQRKNIVRRRGRYSERDQKDKNEIWAKDSVVYCIHSPSLRFCT